MNNLSQKILLHSIVCYVLMFYDLGLVSVFFYLCTVVFPGCFVSAIPILNVSSKLQI